MGVAIPRAGSPLPLLRMNRHRPTPWFAGCGFVGCADPALMPAASTKNLVAVVFGNPVESSDHGLRPATIAPAAVFISAEIPTYIHSSV
jgi:hypothetical protein